MSADRWSPCPRCRTLRFAAAHAANEQAQASYGVVSLAEFQDLLAEADRLAGAAVAEGEATLREDWEVARPDADGVTVVYACHCDVCDLRLRFEHTEPFPELAS